jgi:phospholipid transport system substrate-binding protein
MAYASTHTTFGSATHKLRLLLATVAVALAFAALPALAADKAAESYAQGLIDRGFALLKDNSGGDAARRARFHAFVLQNVDAEKTALFTLGQYRRGAGEDVLRPFVDAFREYATAVYESRLEERQAQELKVVGSVENKAGDVTVNAEAKDANAAEPVRIGLRLLGSGGNYKVVDVQAAGIWLSIEQRDQFATFLSKNNGDIKVLTAHLIEQTKQVRAGKKAPATN